MHAAIIKNKQSLFALGIFTLIALLFLYRPIFKTHSMTPFDIQKEFDQTLGMQEKSASNYLLSDATHQFYPATSFLLKHLSNGIVPLWNPHQFGGTPFIADPQVRPLEFTRLVSLPFSFSVQAYLIASAYFTLLFSGFFMYLFCRSQNFTFHISLFAGIGFMLSGPFIVWLQYPLASGFLWMPFILLCLHRIFEGNKKFVPLLAGATLFLLFSGQPQMMLIVGITSLIFYIAKCITYKKWFTRINGTIILAIVLGVGMSVFLLGPQFAYIKTSTAYEDGRSHQDQVSTLSPFHIVDNAKLLIKRVATFGILTIDPNYFGNPMTRDFRFPEQNVLNNYNEITLSAGLITLISAIFSVPLFKRKSVLFWIIGTIVSFGISILLPYFALLAKIPVLSKINVGRFRFVFVLCLIMCACFCLQWITHTFSKKRSTFIVGILSALLFAELFLHFSAYNGTTTTSSDQLANTSFARTLRNERFIGLSNLVTSFRTSFVPNEATALGLYDLRGSNPLYPPSLKPLIGTLLNQHGAYVLASSIPSQDIANRTSLSYVFCQNELCDSQIPTGWKKIDSNNGVTLYNNPFAFPRAFTVPQSDFAIEDVRTATIESENPNRVSVTASTTSDAILVLNDTFDSGWQATVEGKRVPVELINGFARGVHIPKGTSRIEFSYHIQHGTLYVMISAVSFLLFCCLSAFIFKKKYSL